MGTGITADVEVSARTKFQITGEVVRMTKNWMVVRKVMSVVTLVALGLSLKVTSAVSLGL